MNFSRVEYTGDGAGSNLISVGFRPSRVQIYCDELGVNTAFTTTSTETTEDRNPAAGIVCSNATQVNVGLDYLDSIGGSGTNTSNKAYILYAWG